ncbi:MAG: tetratricopeptide repeat protein, partial [Acidobacteriota bacterium]
MNHDSRVRRCSSPFRPPPGMVRLVASAVLASLLAPSVPAQVVVEDLPSDSALARAGVEPGDVLAAWAAAESATDGREAAEQRQITGPLTFELLRLDQAPRGTVVVQGQRRGAVVSFTVEPGDWRVRVRPPLSAAELATYAAVRQQVVDGGGGAALAQVAEAAGAAEDRPTAIWWWLRSGELWAEGRAFDLARSAYQRATELAVEDRDLAAVVAYCRGRLAEAANDLPAAEATYRSVVASYGAAAESSLLVARSHARLGKIAWAHGDLGQVAQSVGLALRLTQALASHSVELAERLNDAAYMAQLQGDNATAAEQLARAHDLLAELAPASPAMADTLHYQALVERGRGLLTAAESTLRGALELSQRLASTEADAAVAYRLRALGELQRMQGDFALAEESLRQAQAIQEQAVPGGWQLALTLTALADVLDDGGRDGLAEPLYRRALAVLENLGNEYLAAHVLGNLATVLAERGEVEEAARHFQRTLTIYRQKTPGSPGIPWALQQLGLAAIEASDLEVAESHF